MKSEYVEVKDISNWMNDVKVSTSQALPGGKGKIVAIHEPQPIDTKFGKRMTMQVVINGSDGSTINTRLFLPQQFPMIHPKSNLGKIMAQNGCKELKELLGKEVEVVQVGDMLWNIKTE